MTDNAKQMSVLAAIPLIMAKIPCKCGGAGYYAVQVGDNEWEQDQCQPCYETGSELRAILNAVRQGGINQRDKEWKALIDNVNADKGCTP